MSTPTNPLVRVSFSDGYRHEWTIPEHDTVENTLEQIRQTIVHSLWFQIPGTGKSYSPHAIVSIEIIEAAIRNEDASAAERLGQGVREHVIDPINES
jgi:hypothetical protein